MRKGVRHHEALALPLQPIIADRGSRLHRRFDVTRLDKLPLLLRVVRPYAGQTIGLQLDLHLQVIGRRPVALALDALYLRQDAEQVLHVMPDLVRDYIGLCELAGLAAAAVETGLQVSEKRRVEVNVLIVGAVERAHRRLSEPARRRVSAGE